MRKNVFALKENFGVKYRENNESFPHIPKRLRAGLSRDSRFDCANIFPMRLKLSKTLNALKTFRDAQKNSPRTARRKSARWRHSEKSAAHRHARKIQNARCKLPNAASLPRRGERAPANNGLLRIVRPRRKLPEVAYIFKIPIHFLNSNFSNFSTIPPARFRQTAKAKKRALHANRKISGANKNAVGISQRRAFILKTIRNPQPTCAGAKPQIPKPPRRALRPTAPVRELGHIPHTGRPCRCTP